MTQHYLVGKTQEENYTEAFKHLKEPLKHKMPYTVKNVRLLSIPRPLKVTS